MLLVLISCGAFAASDWLQGGFNTFHEAHNPIVTRGSSTPGKPAWSLLLDSAPYATAIVRKDTTFLSSYLGEILLVHTTTGSQIWRRSIDGATFSAAYLPKEDLYIVPWRNAPHISAFDPKDGTEVWRYTFSESDPCPSAKNVGITAVESAIYVSTGFQPGSKAPGGAVIKLDAQGNLLWTSCVLDFVPTPGFDNVNHAIQPVVFHQGKLFASDQWGEHIRVLDPESGKVTAKWLASPKSRMPVSQGLVVDPVRGRILACTMDGYLRVFTPSGNMVWEVKLVSPGFDPTSLYSLTMPALIADRYFIGTHVNKTAARCVSAESGQIEWTRELIAHPVNDGAPGGVVAQPCVAGDLSTVYFSSGNSHVYALSTETGETEWVRVNPPNYFRGGDPWGLFCRTWVAVCSIHI